MAPKAKTLNAYERQRLDNIRRNGEMMASLLLHRTASQLSKPKPKPKPATKKPKPETQIPIVIRRSLRTRGIPRSSDPLSQSPSQPPPPPPSCPPRKRGPLLIPDAFVPGPTESPSPLISTISTAQSDPGPVKSEVFDPRSELLLRPENAAKVVADRILTVRFLPLADRPIVAVGNKIGNLGFWDVDFQQGDGDGIYLFHPHSSPVSGISVHPFSPKKIFTSSYDGFIRLMDIEKETFNMVVSSEYVFFTICQSPRDADSLYIGEGGGFVRAWDERVGKASSFWELHGDRINTVDFSAANVNLMATSSTDGCVCIWDLRRMKKSEEDYESLKRIDHKRAVHSACFSPSGKLLATTR